MIQSSRIHLVADQVPLLLIVILSEEPGFVWRQVHRILENRKKHLKIVSISFIHTTLFPLFFRLTIYSGFD